MNTKRDADGDVTIHRMLLEMGEIQLQLTALVLADLEAIATQVMALNPTAATNSQELNAAFAANHAEALANAREMIETIRERVAQLQISPQETE
jgi:hypothetical protein